jgi:hypothetical protein
MIQKQLNDFRKINFTGKPLSEDMIDEKTFDSVSGLPLLLHRLDTVSRVRVGIEYLNGISDKFDYVIIENDLFGVSLFDALYPKVKFLISCKKPNSQEHAFWQKLDRIKLNPQPLEVNFGAHPFKYPPPVGFM